VSGLPPEVAVYVEGETDIIYVSEDYAGSGVAALPIALQP
jgi:hypothetical protein